MGRDNSTGTSQHIQNGFWKLFLKKKTRYYGACHAVTLFHAAKRYDTLTALRRRFALHVPVSYNAFSRDGEIRFAVAVGDIVALGDNLSDASQPAQIGFWKLFLKKKKILDIRRIFTSRDSRVTLFPAATRSNTPPNRSGRRRRRRRLL